MAEFTKEQIRKEIIRRELEKRGVSLNQNQQEVDSSTPQARTEQLISNRPSMMQSLAQDPTTLSRFKQHPLGTSLRTIGGALELAEGIPASIGLDLQKGRPQDILQNLGKVATGQRPAQRGDILRAIGAPESIAATAGVLSGMPKFMPDAAVANTVIGGISKASKLTQIPQLVGKYGTKALAKTMSIFSKVPEESIEKAISNPKFLDPKWIKKEDVRVKDMYKKVVQPMIDDSSKKVDVSNLKNISEDLGLLNKSGDWTKTYSSMKATEKSRILRWEKAMQKGKVSFNDADALIGEMDSSLKSTYRSKEAGKTIDFSDDFVRTTKTFRDKLNNIRKDQYPEVAKVLDDYSTLKGAKNISKNFDVWYPHFLPIMAAGALGAAGQGAYAPLVAGAIPKVQSYGIRASSGLGRTIGQSGAAIPEMLFEQWRAGQ